MPSDLPARVVSALAFVGRGGGPVKALGGFKKGHHTLPDTANAVTNAFLGKVCQGELSDEAEQLFQGVRSGLGYKRKDLTLTVTSPSAVLTAKDFAVEIVYSLEERDPARYLTTTTLRELVDLGVARSEGFERVFAGRFSEISFALLKGARVEAVIDAIESLEGEGGLEVNYPSDCRECRVRVQGVAAEVCCTGPSLDMVFPRAGSPAELIDAFGAVREAFQISPALRGLIA